MKSAHPYLMASLIDWEEKDEYLGWLDELRKKKSDIYTFFAEKADVIRRRLDSEKKPTTVTLKNGKTTTRKPRKSKPITRKRMKVIFEQAISGSGRGPYVKVILDYFLAKFPTLWIIINSSGKDGNPKTQMRLQQIESSAIIPAFEDADFEICIQRHDSLMVRDCDREKARELINKHCMEKLGYTIPFGD
jgi:hypothetical protein